MTRFQAIGAVTPPAPTCSVVGGEIGAETAGVWYVALVTRTRFGFTRTGSAVAVTIAEGEGVAVTIPSTVRTGCCDVQRVYVVLSRSSDMSEGCPVACVYGVNPVTGEEEELPVTIALDRDEHFVLTGVEETRDNLPEGEYTCLGQRRLLSSEGVIVERTGVRDGEEVVEIWEEARPQRFSAWVSSTEDEYGCDRDMGVVSTDGVLGSSFSAQFPDANDRGFVLVNTGGTEIPSRRRLIVSLFKDGEEVTGAYSGQLILSLVGYSETGNWSLDTSGLTVGEELRVEGGAVYYLERSLPPNWGLAFRVRLEYDAGSTPALARPSLNSRLEIYAQFGIRQSDYTPDGGAMGDYIADGIFVVPGGQGLYPIVTGGRGRIEPYAFPSLGAQVVAGVVSGVGGQKIALTQNGVAYAVSQVPQSARLLAIVSTETATGKATEWVSVSLGNTNIIRVSATHPSKVRSDYPDAVAGESAGLNATALRVYVKSEAGEIRYWDAGIENVVFVGTLAGTVIDALPSVGNSVGLFEPNVSVEAVSGSGVLSAGAYQVCVAYRYVGTVSEVSHSPALGCMVRLGGNTIASTIYDSKFWKGEVGSVDSLRSLSAGELSSNHVRVVGGTIIAIYSREAGEGVTDDGFWGVLPEGGGQFTLLRERVIVATKSALKAFNPRNIGEGQLVVCRQNTALYVFSDEFTEETDDGENFLVSTGGNSSSGWKKVSGASENGGAMTGTQIKSALEGLSDKLSATAIATSSNRRFISDTQLTQLSGVVTAVGTKADSEALDAAVATLSEAIGNKLAKPGTVTQNGMLVTINTDMTLVPVISSPGGTTTTTLGFTQPAIGGNVTVTVGNNIYVTGQYLFMVTGGSYEVGSPPLGTTLPANNLILINRNTSSWPATPGSPIGSGKLVVPSGRSGADGASAITWTTHPFDIPAVGENEVVQVLSASGFLEGIDVKIDNGGTFKVYSVVNSTTIRVENTGSLDITSPGLSLPSGQTVVVVGRRGETGAVESASSLELEQQSVDPPQVSGKTLLYAKEDDKLWARSPSLSPEQVMLESDLDEAIATLQTAIDGRIASTQKGAPGGVAPLNAEGKLDPEFLDVSARGYTEIAQIVEDLSELTIGKLSSDALEEGEENLFVSPPQKEKIDNLPADINQELADLETAINNITGGDAIAILENGTQETDQTISINFIGASVTATGGAVTVTITSSESFPSVTDLYFYY